MKYFNQAFLLKILNQYGPFKIFVNKEFLNITDESDIADPKNGVGYKSDGKPLRFDYINITQIKIGEEILTKDLLNPEEQKPEEPDAESGSKEPTADKGAQKAPKQEKPEPKKREESFKPGDKVVVISEWLGYKKGILSEIDGDKYFVRIFNSKTGSFKLQEVQKGEISRG